MTKITTFSEYSKRAAETQMESCKNEDYLRLGLISEVGELAAIFKRAIRGDFKLEDKQEDIILELGDICWYLERLYYLYYNRSVFINWNRDEGFIWESCRVRHRSVVHPEWKMPQLLASVTKIYNIPESLSVRNGQYPSRTKRKAFVNTFSDIAILSNAFGFTIWDVLTANIEKLAKRKAQGQIIGSGDHREDDLPDGDE